MPDTIDTIVPEGTPTDTLKQTQQTLFIVPEGTPTGGRRAFMPDIIDTIVPEGTPTYFAQVFEF